MSDSFSKPGTAFAIVSPCSQCKNQLAEQGEDGKPHCPRRKWQKDYVQSQQPNNKSDQDPQIPILAAFGTEGTPQEGDNSLRNPVYLDQGNVTLVWIATLRDNSGIRDQDNNVVAPQILDPSFIPDNTDWIHCRSLPYIPAQHESGYRQQGALKEGDAIFAITADSQQHAVGTTTDGSNTNIHQQVLVEGVVNKVNLVYFTPRKAVEVDYTVQGT